MVQEPTLEDGEPEPQRGTRATPAVRRFFRILGFDDGLDEE
jgi:hypothetical protein